MVTNLSYNEIRRILMNQLDVTDDGEIDMLSIEHAVINICDYVNQLEVEHFAKLVDWY